MDVWCKSEECVVPSYHPGICSDDRFVTALETAQNAVCHLWMSWRRPGQIRFPDGAAP